MASEAFGRELYTDRHLSSPKNTSSWRPPCASETGVTLGCIYAMLRRNDVGGVSRMGVPTDLYAGGCWLGTRSR